MDRVQVLKQESAALGGDASDEVPYDSPIEPQEDAIEAAGVYLQDESNRDENVLITRVGDNMVFRDVANPGGKTLSELSSASGGDSPQFFQVHEYGGGQAVGYWPPQTLGFNGWPTVGEVSTFSWSAANHELTILKSGQISVCVRASIEQVSGNGRTIPGMYVERYTGGAWSPLYGSTAYLYLRNSSDGHLGTMVSETACLVTGGDILRARMWKESGSGTIVVVPDATNMVVHWCP